MNLVTVKELYRNTDKYIDQTIEVGGWVRNIRDSKTFGFIVLNDGTFFETLQIVFHDNMDNFTEICKLNVGAAIIVKGKLVATPQAKQKFEIQADEVFVEGPSTPDYPVQPKRHSLEYLEQLHIYVLEQTHSRQYSVYVLYVLMQSISSSRKEDSYM